MSGPGYGRGMRFRHASVLLASILALAALSGCFHSAKDDTWVDLVSDKKYSKLLVEIDYVNGQQPRAGSVDLLEQRIDERLSKPGGTTVRQTAFASTRTVYSNDNLKQVEATQRNDRPAGDTMTLYILFLNGHHEKDTSNEKVLGVQYDYSSIAIFKETVDSSGGLLGLSFTAADVERAVLIHELGHAMGLVNNGLKMVHDHEDKDHPKHSNSRDSVMYWAVESTLGLPGLSTIPTNFDANDIEDIRAGGGK